MAKSIQSTIEKHRSEETPCSEFTSQGTPILNLLNEYRDKYDKMEETKEDCVIDLDEVFSQIQSENAQTQSVTQTSSTSHTSGNTFLVGHQIQERIYKVP